MQEGYIVFAVNYIDQLLNRITMYRLLVYGLVATLLVAIVQSSSGRMQLSGSGIALSVLVASSVCYAVNRLLSELYKIPRNSDSWLITALIMSCIFPPTTTTTKAIGIAVAAVIAMASKYILVLRAQHLFNPAALAAFVVGLLGLANASWWIGSPEMLPIVVAFGLLIARKTHRFQMVSIFIATALLIFILVGLQRGSDLPQVIKTTFLSWPLIFFATVMLTEPATMPSTGYYQKLYAGLVGALFASQLRSDALLGISTSPETVLVAGNLLTAFVTPKTKLCLKLKGRHRLTPSTYEYVFEPNRPLKFEAGQYLEWTLPHKGIDSRGNRRSFTVASSPSEKTINLGVKFYNPSSSFKRALFKMKPGDSLVAGQVSGDFCLPTDPKVPLVFVAGGIGFTPFRSMLQQLMDSKEKRDVTLIYAVSKVEEIAYKEFIEQAEKKLGMQTLYVVSSGDMPNKKRFVSKLSTQELALLVPDFKQHHYYISGPPGLVKAYKKLLVESGVKRSNIVRDYFSGY